ncbi:sugar ABC transporter substrate-binding protein [Paenibacillus xanthanilyticus]|uniref:Sugar ABC transporter substrate-binding protein n=1 Tax=Paenibacillus xanthanilyticus TaxID=1783531 RepID=A0ABV8K198_9BACL
MRHARRLPPAALAALLALTLGGCFGGESGQLTPSSGSGAPRAEAPRPLTETFGIIYPMAYPTYETVTQDASAAAEAHGVALIASAPDEANTEQQIRIMETMIKQQVAGIAISPVDSDALTPVIDKAQAAGIPVVTFESDAPGSARAAYVGADNYLTGKQSAIAVSQLLGGKGMILVENGMEEMLGMRQRLAGFIDYLNANSAIDVLEVHHNQGSEEKAMSDIETMIEAHPHFDALVGLDFVSASASTLIWKAKGLDRLAVSMGMTTTSEEALLNGQLAAVISQREEDWGALIMETLLAASKDEPVAERMETGIQDIRQDDVR